MLFLKIDTKFPGLGLKMEKMKGPWGHQMSPCFVLEWTRLTRNFRLRSCSSGKRKVEELDGNWNLLEPRVKGDRRGGRRTDRRRAWHWKKNSSCTETRGDNVRKKQVLLILWIIISEIMGAWASETHSYVSSSVMLNLWPRWLVNSAQSFVFPGPQWAKLSLSSRD